MADAPQPEVVPRLHPLRMAALRPTAAVLGGDLLLHRAPTLTLTLTLIPTLSLTLTLTLTLTLAR